MKEKKRIIVAVDVPTIHDPDVIKTLQELTPHIAYFKIGLELIMAGEASAAISVVGNPHKIMFDAKLHDIPQTVANAVTRLAEKNVGMFTLHASGGMRMIEAAVEKSGNTIPLVVTVLTSHDKEEHERIFRTEINDQIFNFALMAMESGAEALVCSAHDIPAICRAEKLMQRRLLKVTPGIRVDWSTQKVDDQRRIMTPVKAVQAGADYLVIGRDIMQAEKRHGCSPLQAVLRIDEELARFEASASIEKQREALNDWNHDS